MCRKKLQLLLLFCCTLIFAAAQNRKVTGTVTNSDNTPAPGITIQVKGTQTFTKTADNGSFSIEAPVNATLVFSGVGFETIERLVPGQGAMTVALNQSNKTLSDVVVVGYGTSRRRDLTGAVGSVNLTNTEKTPVFGTAQLLQGQVSGVQVTQTNSQPGASFTVRVRGTNSISFTSDPLYVVDGYAGADISAINPNDIASIEVLKDASSTAIYGSRGSNGVVIITTKKGTAGRNTISFDLYTGVQQVAKKLKLMDAQQFASYLNAVTTYNNQYNTIQTPLPYTDAQIKALGKGTDWQDELFRSAPIRNFNVALNGGNTDTRYYLSMNYFDQDGIIIGSDYKRGTVRFNLDQRISNKVRFGFNSQVSYSIQDQANVNTNGGSTGGTLLDALRASPIVPVYDSTGDFTFQNGPQPYVEILGNPVAAARLNTDQVKTGRVFANAYAEYEVIKGLRLRSTIGAELRDQREDVFRPTTTYLGKTTNGYAQIATANNNNWLNENTITYDREINHANAINAVAGFTFQDWRDYSSSATSQGLSTNNLGTDNLGIGSSQSTGSNKSGHTLNSVLGRINYRLLDRYLFTFTFRGDGSSRFGSNNKWGYFPSGAFAWRVSEEKFIKRIDQISDLKLRASYGSSGNQEFDNYVSLPRYGTNSYALNGVRVVGVSPSNIANNDIKWEPTLSFDGGIDLGLFRNRIVLSADYYNKKTTKLLFNVPIPTTSGFSSITENIGSVQNRGIEISLNTVNVNTRLIKWSTSFNYSRNRNKVLSLGTITSQLTGNVSSSLFPSGGQFSSILQVGQPIGSFYGYVFNGIWQSTQQIQQSGTKQAVKPGDPRYMDLNGDSAITSADRTIIGHALPKFTYGFTSNLTVGRFNLFVLIQGVQGVNILNENRIEAENGTTLDNKFAYVATQSWTGTGTSNRLPAVGSTLRRGLGVTSDILEDGSYMRFKTITLSYDLPIPRAISAFKGASIYVTGQNLFTITNYSGYDPEVNSYSNSSGNFTSLNTDYNPYPNIKTYTAGIRFNL